MNDIKDKAYITMALPLCPNWWGRALGNHSPKRQEADTDDDLDDGTDAN